jgi:hypothetical protein
MHAPSAILSGKQQRKKTHPRIREGKASLAATKPRDATPEEEFGASLCLAPSDAALHSGICHRVEAKLEVLLAKPFTTAGVGL